MSLAPLGNIDPDMPVGQLSISQQQLLEIANALALDSRMLKPALVMPVDMGNRHRRIRRREMWAVLQNAHDPIALVRAETCYRLRAPDRWRRYRRETDAAANIRFAPSDRLTIHLRRAVFKTILGECRSALPGMHRHSRRQSHARELIYGFTSQAPRNARDID